MRLVIAVLLLTATGGIVHCTSGSSAPPGGSAPMGGGNVGAIGTADAGEDAGDTTPDPCSTGAPYDANTTFAARDPEAPVPPRQCTKRCGDTSYAYWGAGGGPSPTISALPTGECHGAAPCAMAAVLVWCGQPIASQPTLGPVGTLLQFECHCSDSGVWACSGNYLAGGGTPPCHDGGTDSADAGDGG